MTASASSRVKKGRFDTTEGLSAKGLAVMMRAFVGRLCRQSGTRLGSNGGQSPEELTCTRIR